MDASFDSWAMFRKVDMGDNVEEMPETADCKVLRMKDKSGDGLMTIYRVFDGVYLMYNDFHMARCYSPLPTPTEYLRGSLPRGTY